MPPPLNQVFADFLHENLREPSVPGGLRVVVRLLEYQARS